MVDISVVNVLLGTLRDLLVEEAKFLSEVGGKAKNVESDLRILHGLLMDADRNKSDSDALQNCIVELKDLAIEADKVLEKYAVEVGSKKGGSLKKKLQRFICILCECYTVHQVGGKIDGISSRLADLKNAYISANGGESSSNADHHEQQRLLRLRYAHEIDQHFVGMERDIYSILSKLMGPSSSLISICGMGGLGKTTLARKIYHHRVIQQRFGRSWVCVTQQFEVKSVLRQIFKQVDEERSGIDGMEMNELVPKLYSVLEQREWLIVIDDIWESSHWEILKPAFPMYCKVLLTTRNENISQQFDVHKLGFLSEDEGWELLRKTALSTTNDDATAVSRLENEGRLIVQRCGRLPLAIYVVGGILRQKQKISVEWKNVTENIESYLKNEGGIEKNSNGIKQVLDLSFDVLPYYLKLCFLYLACFPEDHEIDAERLYLLWMAEGLISSEEKENSETLRDVAERYLTELEHRCMVQVIRRPYVFTHRNFTSCRLHDLMRDLGTSKAVEKKFLNPIELRNHQNDIPPIDKVALDLKNWDGKLSVSCKRGIKGLRSFLVLRSDGKNINLENIANLKNSKYLKILVFDGFHFDEGKLPGVVSKLIHIRYLSIYNCIVEELPQRVCHFPYINTLDLRVQYNKFRLPNMIQKMKRLRHLFLAEHIEVIGKEKLRLEGLNELQTLEGICSETTCIADVANLMNLRLLSATIKDKESLSVIAKYMSGNQCKLQQTSLTVELIDFDTKEEDTSIVKNMLLSPSLLKLIIKSCKIECAWPCYEQGMCTNLIDLETKESSGIGALEEFGKYPALQYIWLKGDDNTKEMRCGANSFPELKRLLVYDFWKLENWEMEEGAMPKLIDVLMVMCIELKMLPKALGNIKTLRSLECSHVSSELEGRMKVGQGGGEEGEDGQDYANFSHIPNLLIR